MSAFFLGATLLSRRNFIRLSVAAAGLLALSRILGSEGPPGEGMPGEVPHPQPAWTPCAFEELRYARLQPALCRYGAYDVQALNEGNVRIFGWFMCEDPDGRFIAPERLYCILDQNEIWRGNAGLPRADVGRKFPGAPLGVGFDLRRPEPKRSISVWILDAERNLWQGRGSSLYPARKDDL